MSERESRRGGSVGKERGRDVASHNREMEGGGGRGIGREIRERERERER